MPEIRELLQEAAPAARPYDENAVRARVARRRRRRAGVRVVGASMAVAGLVGGYVATRSAPEQTVVAEPPPAGVKSRGVTGLTVADGDVWVAYEDGSIGRNGESRTLLQLDEPTRALRGDDSTLWSLAADGAMVTAIDLEAGVAHQWRGEGIKDLEPLGDGRAAVTAAAEVPGELEVAILERGAEGIGVVEWIAVGPRPEELVLGTDGQLWVQDAIERRISAIDPDTGFVIPFGAISGTLLAASDDGRLWVAERERVTELDPDILDEGQSVATGARYHFASATTAIDTGERLYVGGPTGIMQFGMNDQLGLPVSDDEPTSMAMDGDDLVYVLRGVVHRFEAEIADESERTSIGIAQARDDAARFLRDELGWSDATLGEGVSNGRGDEHTMTARSPSLGRELTIAYRRAVDGWELAWFQTSLNRQADTALSVSLGNGDDSVFWGMNDSEAEPQLTIRYGETESTFGPDDRVAGIDHGVMWEGDLGYVPNTSGWLQILLRNAEGVVVEGVRTPLPPGPFAAS